MNTLNETDVQTDLNAVNDQLTKLVDELNKINAAREQLVTQIQNLNGVSMYLRGKLPEEEADVADIIPDDNSEAANIEGENLDRSVEHPST